MALARTDIGIYGKKEAGTAAFSTEEFTPPANSLLVVRVYLMRNSGESEMGQPTIEGGGLTWTARTTATTTLKPTWSTKCVWFTAPVGGSPSKMKVTVDDASNLNIYEYVVSVLAFTGYNTSTPIGGMLGSGTTNIGDGEESRELSEAPASGDVTLVSIDCDASKGPPKPSLETGWTLIHEKSVSAESGIAVAFREGSTSKTVKVKDSYTAAGGFSKAGMGAIVVKVGEEGGTTFNDSGSGTVALSGSSVETAASSDSASGSMALAGGGAESATAADSSSGQLSLGGSGTEGAVGSDAGSGSFALTGSGLEEFAPTYTDSAAGTIVLSGSGTDSLAGEDAGTGGFVTSGSGVESTVASDSGTGTFSLTGSGVDSWESRNEFEDTGTGTMALSGGAAESFTHSAAWSGELPLGGSSVDSLIGEDERDGVLVLDGYGIESYSHENPSVSIDRPTDLVLAPHDRSLALAAHEPGVVVLASRDRSLHLASHDRTLKLAAHVPGTVALADRPARSLVLDSEVKEVVLDG